jgi:hypothetical protein
MMQHGGKQSGDRPSSGEPAGTVSGRKRNGGKKPRATLREIADRTNIVIRLMAAGSSTRDIVDYCCTAYGVTPRQAQNILADARQAVCLEANEQTRDELRAMNLLRLEKILVVAKDPKIKLAAIREINRLYGLHMEQEIGKPSDDGRERRNRVLSKLSEMDAAELDELHEKLTPLIRSLNGG